MWFQLKNTCIILTYFTMWSEVTQSYPTLCDPTDGSPSGSTIPGKLQARTLEWVDISFSNAWKWKVKVKSLSCIWLLATPWTAAYQASLSMGFSRQDYWSGVPLPSPFYSNYSWTIFSSKTTSVRVDESASQALRVCHQTFLDLSFHKW